MPIFSTVPSVSHTKTGKRPMTKRPRVEVIGSSQVMETPDPTPDLDWWSRGGVVSDGEQDFLDAIGHNQATNSEMINTPPMVDEFRTHPELEETWDLHSEATGLQQYPSEAEVVQEATGGVQHSQPPSSSSNTPLFHDYDLTLDMMMVSMAEVEGRSQTSANNNIIPEHQQQQQHQINNNVNQELAEPQPQAILPEPTWNQNTEMDIADSDTVDNTWGHNTFDKADFLRNFDEAVNNNPLDSFINNNNTLDDIAEVISRPSGNTQDLLAFACGINEIKQEPSEDDQQNNDLLYPVPNVHFEVIEEEKPKVKKQKRTKDTAGFVVKFEKKGRKKVGRPEVQEPITITEVPKKGKINLSQEQISSLKYRRMRDLNNEASRKCRKNRKNKAALAEMELEEEMRKNEDLRQRLAEMEKERDDLKNKLVSMGIFLPVN